MLDRAIKDISFVATRLGSAGFGVAMQQFGSASTSASPQGDIDVAVIVSPAEKPHVLTHIRYLAKDSARSMNWEIDAFDDNQNSWGYNSKAPGTLHFFVLNHREYNGDSPIAANIRAAANSTRK